MDRKRFRLVILISQGILLLISVILYFIFRRGVWQTDLWNGQYTLTMIAFGGLLSGVGMRLFSIMLGEAWPAFGENMDRTVIQTLQGIELGPVELLLISLPPAIIEEIFFRGLLQPFVGIWIGALIFALAHSGISRRLWAHGLHAFIVGLFLGWLYLATGSLLTTMIAHFVNNLLAGLYVQKKSIF